MTDEDFMRMAIAKAREGLEKGQTPFGACIVRHGEVVTCVHNVVWETTDITAHAEVHAIREACKKLQTIDLSGCNIYSTCEPCSMCFSACHWANVSKIFFGAKIADAQSANFNELTLSNETMKKLGDSPIEIVPNFLQEECQKVFREWLSSEQAKAY